MARHDFTTTDYPRGCVPWNLAFKRPAKTSRDTLTHKPSWFIKLTDENGREGWGECSIIPGLSLDDPAAIAAFFSKAQLIRRSGRRKSRCRSQRFNLRSKWR